jgi:DNA-binding transcriptional ArsR family regulator
MKRDMELVRQVLLQTEQSTSVDDVIDLNIEGYSPQEISYHVKILFEAGLLDARDCGDRRELWKPRSLTWDGHEFLDAARNETVWKKTTEIVKDKGGSVPFEVLKDLLIKGVATLLGGA